MNVAGFVKLTVNETGEKTLLLDYEANDIQMTDYFSSFVSQDDAESLISLQQVEAKLKAKYGEESEFKDMLILATFSHQSVPSFNGESTEWDDETEIIDVLVLDQNYKTTWQRNLTTLYEFEPLEEQDEIHAWEEFYDEDFSLFKTQEIKSSNAFLF